MLLMSEPILIDASQLKVLLSLSGGNGTKLVNDLIDMFEQYVPESIAFLKEEIDKQDIDRIEHYSHKLKGSCANIGAMRLRMMSEEMEQLAKKKQVGDFPARVQKVEEVYTETIDALRKDWYNHKKT